LGSGVWGLKLLGLDFRVSGCSSRVQNEEFRGWRVGSGIWGLGFGVLEFRFKRRGLRVEGLMLRIYRRDDEDRVLIDVDVCPDRRPAPT